MRPERALISLLNYWTFLFVCSLAVIGWHASILAFPSLNYDELMWARAATRAPEGPFYLREIGGIPTYLMSYIGSTKAFIMMPFVNLFDSNELNVRLVNISILLFCISITSCALLRLSHGISLLIGLFLIINPLMSFYAHLDMGPSNLGSCFRLILFSLAVLILSRPHNTVYCLSFAGILIFGTLGLWDKLSFIWFLAPYTVGLVAMLLFLDSDNPFYFRNLFQWKNVVAIFVTSVLLIIIATFFLAFYDETLTSSGYKFYPERLWLFLYSFGGIQYLHFLGINLQSFKIIPFLLSIPLFLVWSVSILVSVLEVFVRKKYDLVSKLVLLLSFVTFSGLFVILFTPIANKTWHIYTLFPAPIVSGLLIFQRKCFGNFIELSRLSVIFIFFLTLAVVSRSYTTSLWVNLEQGTTSWTRLANTSSKTAFFEASVDYVGKTHMGDWGLMTQFIWYRNGVVLSDLTNFGSVKGMDEYEKVAFYQDYLNNGQLVFHGERATAFKNYRQSFITLLESGKISGRVCEIYRAVDGVVIVEVYRKTCSSIRL